MAVATNTYFNNAMPGWIQGGADIDIYETNVTPKWAVGTGFKRSDGNVYRYGQFVTATTQGLVVSHDISETDNASTNALVVTPAASYQMEGDPRGVYPGQAGSRYIIYTLAAVTANQFAGGYITTNLDTGYGYIYRIKGNTATGNPDSGNIRIELCDTLQVTLSATTDSGIIGSMYNDLRACSVATDFLPVGVTMANQGAATFGWVCTHGVCTALQAGTVAAGDIIQAGNAAAGSYSTLGVGTTTVAAAAGAAILGYSVQIPAGNSGSYGTIYLQLE